MDEEVCQDGGGASSYHHSHHPLGSGMLVFSADLARDLATQHQRLAPVYVGVRRVRPSSRLVRKAMIATAIATSKEASSSLGTLAAIEAAVAAAAPTIVPVYKITTEDGQERRMTAKEKREAKWQQKLNAKKRKEEAKLVGARHQGAQQQAAVSTSQQQHYEAVSAPETLPMTSTETQSDVDVNGSNDDRYFWPTASMPNGASLLESDFSSSLQEELADLRGERDGVPPVMLPPALARLVQTMHSEQEQNQADSCASTNQNGDTTRVVHVTPDDELAQQWATALSDCLKVPEAVRQGETDWRPMPYRLMPEVWNRVRPQETLPLPQTSAKQMAGFNTRFVQSSQNQVTELQESETAALVGSSIKEAQPFPPTETTASKAYAYCSVRPHSLLAQNNHFAYQKAEDEAAIVELLHRRTNLHISCGAKFGCDFLLYDGPRTERHAFAGLRIVFAESNYAREKDSDRGGIDTSIQFPLPTAYDMTGYVRCLNTAGKLALLVTVIRDVDIASSNDTTQQQHQQPVLRVLFVDLALVKVARTTTKRPRKTMEQRMKNLAKSTKATNQNS